jgi:hypothetical protein
MRLFGSGRPSPAIVVSALALVAALAGTAVAGPGANTSVSKKAIKKIPRKEANKQITNRAPTLAVASADTAGSAGTAGSANDVLAASIEDCGVIGQTGDHRGLPGPATFETQRSRDRRRRRGASEFGGPSSRPGCPPGLSRRAGPAASA